MKKDWNREVDYEKWIEETYRKQYGADEEYKVFLKCYKLFLGEESCRSATLHYENIDGKWEYHLSVIDSGASFDHVEINATTLDEAKIEVEKWLEKLYLGQIGTMEEMIEFNKRRIALLHNKEGLVSEIGVQ